MGHDKFLGENFDRDPKNIENHWFKLKMLT